MPNVEPATADCPATLYRVARKDDPFRFSEIDALDAELPNVGNRFDVVGGGVLYASTERIGAYKETLATYRPAASSARYRTASHMAVGSLPAEWRDRRRLASFGLTDALPFLDVESDATLTFLTQELAATLDSLNLSNLDSAQVRGPNRVLTRAIAQWAYTAVGEDDEALYSGIRFSSRFQSHACWAVFEGVTFGRKITETIDKTDASLQAAAQAFNIVVH
ncbi:RES domain-containing protein [Agreia pratensis]|uniref:RES domain-containing protein n=1 Tax=Agreia pratensis TaxID=150121 RepID=UPI00188BC84C|nr:RES domain-containing protein [Agreia pratensis]MBF4636261.1 RES domain-containing protein [Agreia pratensis]